jgi:hypothetical protein
MALEAYYVQACSLSDGLMKSWEYDFMQRLLLMDLAAAFMIIVLLPRVTVYAVFVLQLLAGVFILSYVASLDLPPTLSAMVNGLNMVEQTNEFAWSYLDKEGGSVLLLLMLCKCWLWRRKPVMGRVWRLGVSVTALAVLGGCYSYDYIKGRMDILKPNPPEVLENSILNHLRYRGFLFTWLQEYYYDVPFNYQEVYAEIGCNPDSVMPLPLPDISGRISMIQVESLDWAALYKKINGKEVAPNLNAMARRSLVLKLDGMKHFVSANSEYEMLNSRIARAFFLYFEYLNKYSDSIALPLKSAGYETSLVHGVAGAYMNRRYAYPKMGFDSNFFFEQIKEQGYQVTPGLFEYNIADYDLMKFAADYAKGKDRYLHFLITVTMHASVEAKTPAYEKWDGYWRSVNYFDEGLGLYIKSLPEGSTVILYGDHQSYHGPEKNDLVPFLVYIKGQNLSKLKTPPGMVYTRCELSHYLRRIFARHLDKTSVMTDLAP